MPAARSSEEGGSAVPGVGAAEEHHFYNARINITNDVIFEPERCEFELFVVGQGLFDELEL